MRLCFVFAQSGLLLYLCCTWLAMTSPWLVAGGGAVWLRALLLQLYLEHMDWIFGLPFAVCVLCLCALLFCAYALAMPGARIAGLLMGLAMAIMGLELRAPAGMTLYWLASAAMFVPGAAHCRISAAANRQAQYLLWLCCLAAGMIAWVYPWPECALWLPAGLALFFIFRRLAERRKMRDALIPGALAGLGLGATMPAMAFFCALGCLARYLTAKACRGSVA